MKPKALIPTVKTHPEFHPETRSKSCGVHLQGKFTKELCKPPLKMNNLTWRIQEFTLLDETNHFHFIKNKDSKHHR